jgi:hypothetical protein
MATKYLVRRGETIQPDLILLDGEFAFIKSDRLFYIGDGKTPMSKLKPFSSLVAGDNGQVYTVKVDENGIPHAKPVKEFDRGCEYEFRVSK